MNLILFAPDEVVDGAVSLPADDRRSIHVQKVLGLSSGGSCRVGVIGGPMCSAVVTLSPLAEEMPGEKGLKGRKRKSPFGEGPSAEGCVPIRFDLQFTSSNPPVPGSDPGVDLLLSCPRPKVLGRLAPIFAQLGIRKVVLCRPERVESQYFGTHVLSSSFLMPQFIKGLEQAAADTVLPELIVEKLPLVHTLHRILEEHFPIHSYSRVLCHPPEEGPDKESLPGHLMKDAIDSKRRVVLAIGPEGGWLPHEIDILSREDFRLVGLGTPRILTSEVAVIGAVMQAIAAKAEHTSLRE